MDCRKIDERLGRIEQVLREIRDQLRAIRMQGEDDIDRCPACGSTDIEDTTTMGETPRMTCSDCCRSFEIQEEAADG